MSLQDEQCPALVRGVRLQSDPQTGQPLLLFPEGVIELSETAHDIIVQCDGKTPLRTVIGRLAAAYEVDPRAIAEDVRECLLQLSAQHLVTC